MKTASRSFLIALALAITSIQLVPRLAVAQDTPPPPPPASSPPPAQTYSGGGAGLGIGAFAFLSGLSGVAVGYDQPRFHLEGLFGFNNVDGGGPMGADVTDYRFAIRAWYHLHQGSNSDFSLGGGIGVAMNSAGGMSNTATIFEPGAMARVFLTPNFSLYGTAGLSMVFGDSVQGNQVGFGLGGQTQGGFGFMYYFR